MAENEKPINQTLGVVQAIGGGVEFVGGAALIHFSGGSAIAPGGVLIGAGLDNMATGLMTARDGKSRHNISSNVVGYVAEEAGASEGTAEVLRYSVDLASGAVTQAAAKAGASGARAALEAGGAFEPAFAGVSQGERGVVVLAKDADEAISATVAAGASLDTGAHAGQLATTAGSDEGKSAKKVPKKDIQGSSFTKMKALTSGKPLTYIKWKMVRKLQWK